MASAFATSNASLCLFRCARGCVNICRVLPLFIYLGRLCRGLRADSVHTLGRSDRTKRRQHCKLFSQLDLAIVETTERSVFRGKSVFAFPARIAKTMQTRSAALGHSSMIPPLPFIPRINLSLVRLFNMRRRYSISISSKATQDYPTLLVCVSLIFNYVSKKTTRRRGRGEREARL